jgi:hypothetical protein
MVFDLIILILCTMKLRTARLSGGIATLLMRDGIVSFFGPFMVAALTHGPGILLRRLRRKPRANRHGRAQPQPGDEHHVPAAGRRRACSLVPLNVSHSHAARLQVSVIASTTVFRNVFTLHDAWADAPGSSGAPAKPSSGNYAGGQGLSLRRLPRPAPTHYDLPSFVSVHGGDGVFAENISLAELASPDSKETIAFPSGTAEK